MNRPTATSTMPTASPRGSASGRRRMTKLEKRTTAMIGSRFLIMIRKSSSNSSAAYLCWSSLGSSSTAVPASAGTKKTMP
ncbi:MAG: hypothetical protein AW07_04612 [Candidatus Accumulibacter sp. SK-11]|nr:MAG: hypothetical protein AW07_04612 [Candidatus Accumulibacter sp. SK-11]